MNILEQAILAEGSVNGLAKALDVRQNVISNWRSRGIPKPWEQVLSMRYAEKTPKRRQAKAAPLPVVIEKVAKEAV